MPPEGRKGRMMNRATHALGCGLLTVVVLTAGPSSAQADGSIVGWGDQVVGVNLDAGFVAVAAGYGHSLGLKADGSIVAWGYNTYGQCNVPAPNTGFVAVAAGGYHSLGLKADGSIVAWGYNDLRPVQRALRRTPASWPSRRATTTAWA